MSRLYRFALATLVSTLALLAFGGMARLHPAGSGCGNDWPRCNGSWLPSLAREPLVEYFHRGLAVSVLALSMATMLTALATRGVPGAIRILASAGFVAIILQSLIGGFAARWSAPPVIAMLHLTTAMLFVGIAFATLAAIAARRGAPAWLADLGRALAVAADRPLAIVASIGAAVAFVLLIFGAATSETGALACATWPLCVDGADASQSEGIIHLGYRATALLGTLATTAAAFLAWRRGARVTIVRLALLAVALVAVQSVLNAISTGIGDPSWTSAPQLLIATLVWIAMLGVALGAWGPRPERAVVPGVSQSATHSSGSRVANGMAVPPAAHSALALAAAHPALVFELPLPRLARTRRIVSDYVALAKPGIMTLLLTTTFCAMLMAERGVPPFWLIAVTLLGGALASGGASALNCYLDRDIDGQMSRTKDRAIVAGRVTPGSALLYGVTLSVAAILLLGVFVNWTAASLALAGNLFYVIVYTKLLKRATPYNIVIGGAAGAVPPLVGWAAVTGNLSPLAWGLFAIIFTWTPPHFWALALLKQGEYTRASVPMLPVVRGEAETRRQILIYTVALFAVCVALTPFGFGAIYLIAAVLLNGIFLGYAVWLFRDPSKKLARQMFFYSLWYLALLFAAAVCDRLLIG